MPTTDEKSQSFVLLNFGAGQVRVSDNSKNSNNATKALYQQWRQPVDFSNIVEKLGAKIVDKVEDANVNLSLDNLERDTFIKLFNKEKN